MSKRSFWTLAVGASALLVAGGVFSSNMGFMLSYPLYGPFPDVSDSGTNSIAFPYHPQQDVNRAFDVRELIDDAVAGTFVQISKFLQTNDSLLTYTGSSHATDFFLEPGVGYRVTVAFEGVDLVLIGAHDPTRVINLDAPGTNGSFSGTSDIALPYHAAAETASDIRDEVNAVVPGAFVQISKFLQTDDSLQTYTGAANATDFALVMGESYRIVVSSDVTIVWSHY